MNKTPFLTYSLVQETDFDTYLKEARAKNYTCKLFLSPRPDGEITRAVQLIEGMEVSTARYDQARAAYVSGHHRPYRPLLHKPAVVYRDADFQQVRGLHCREKLTGRIELRDPNNEAIVYAEHFVRGEQASFHTYKAEIDRGLQATKKGIKQGLKAVEEERLSKDPQHLHEDKPFRQRGFLPRAAYDRARRDAELNKLNRHLILYKSVNEDSRFFLGPVDEECFLVDGTYVDGETYRKRKNAFLERKVEREAELREDFLYGMTGDSSLKTAYMAYNSSSEYTADWGVTDREEHKMQAAYNVSALKAKLEELIAEEEARRNEKAEWIRDEIAERLQRAIEEKQDETARTIANDVEEAADKKFARKAGRIMTMRKGVEKLSLVDGDTVTLDDTDLYNLGLEHH